MNTITALNKETSWSIRCIRVLATLSIFLCHIVRYSDISIIKNSAQLFNVGVPIFFIISGFLFSQKDKPNSYGSWLIKRVIRILIPCYIVLLMYFIANVIRTQSLPSFYALLYWVMNIIPTTGLTEMYLPGLEHWWFITDMLICYFVTPFLFWIRKKVDTSTLRFSLTIIGIYVVILSLSSVLLPHSISTLLTSVFSYIIGFFLVKNLLAFNKYIFVVTMIVAVIIRFVASRIISGEKIYEYFVASIAHQLLGVSIFCFLIIVLNHFYKVIIKPKKVISFFDNISYEFYLVHMIMLQGPLAVRLFNVGIYNYILVFILSILFAVFANKIGALIFKLIDNVKGNNKEHKAI